MPPRQLVSCFAAFVKTLSDSELAASVTPRNCQPLTLAVAVWSGSEPVQETGPKLFQSKLIGASG
jgi:hypothetical protein